MKHTVEWFDSGREPKCPPDPEYPDGKDIILAPPDAKYCKVDLPYPAKRCGVYVVTCSNCTLRIGLTTAGRPDDPKSVRVFCGETKQ